MYMYWNIMYRTKLKKTYSVVINTSVEGLSQPYADLTSALR